MEYATECIRPLKFPLLWNPSICLIISGANYQNNTEGRYFSLDYWSGEARECVCVYVCVCLCNIAFVCIVSVSRGKHSRETPAVLMPAVTSSYSVATFIISAEGGEAALWKTRVASERRAVIFPLQASKLYLSSEFAETSLIF